MNIYLTISDSPIYDAKTRQRELALGLLEYALEREFGVNRESLGEFAYGPHGKPYFPGSHIRFNYSHCKYGAVCAASEREVGVDIQEIRTVRPSLIKRVCCDNELRAIETDGDFIRIWAQKEAYVKYTGEGFSKGISGLKGIDTTAFPEWTAVKKGRCYVAVFSGIGGDDELVWFE